MSLKASIDAKRREISSDNLSMSIGELLNLYKDGEIDIHPEFQRVFRWKGRQKSGLIESILLGIPLPPIYVAVNSKGVWEVVDGVQRLSTIFEFMGELRAPGSDESSDELELKKPLLLEGTKHLPELQDLEFSRLDQTLKLEFKRSRLDVKVLAREGSFNSGKFDLFERLNTYGSALSPQEIRNCILVSLNSKLYRSIKDLAARESFRSTTLLTENQLSERYDMDLALRFILLRDADPRAMGDVHDFLRDRMEHIATSKSLAFSNEEKRFREVFDYLDKALGENAFRPWSVKQESFRGAFSLAAFEGLGLSLGKHWESFRILKDDIDMKELVKNLWGTPEYQKSFSGMRARERMLRVRPAADKIVLGAIAAAKKPKKSKSENGLTQKQKHRNSKSSNNDK